MSLIPRATALVSILLLAKLANAQSVSTRIGAQASSIGYASVAQSDEWSLFNNVAGLARMESAFTTISYDLNTRLPNANRIALTAGTPLKLGVLSGGVFKFGDDIYSEQLISLGYANQFGLAALGLKLSYVQYRAEGFGTQTALSISAGGVAHLSEKLKVGAHIQNVNQPAVGDGEERLAVQMCVGVAFFPTSQLSLFGELAKEIDFDATVRAGLEYEIVEDLFFRTGFNLYPATGSGGIGYKLKKIKIDYAIQYGFELSSSHQLSAAWQFAKRAK